MHDRLMTRFNSVEEHRPTIIVDRVNVMVLFNELLEDRKDRTMRLRNYPVNIIAVFGVMALFRRGQPVLPGDVGSRNR